MECRRVLLRSEAVIQRAANAQEADGPDRHGHGKTDGHALQQGQQQVHSNEIPVGPTPRKGIATGARPDNARVRPSVQPPCYRWIGSRWLSAACPTYHLMRR